MNLCESIADRSGETEPEEYGIFMQPLFLENMLDGENEISTAAPDTYRCVWDNKEFQLRKFGGGTYVLDRILAQMKNEQNSTVNQGVVALNDPRHSRRSVLSLAAEFGYVQCVIKFIDAGSPVDFMSIVLAVERGHTECVKVLVNAAAPLTVNSFPNETLLHGAVLYDHAECIPMLVNAGVPINQKWESNLNTGSTALHIAASRGRIGCVTKLVEAGAALNLRDGKQRTALHLTALSGHTECLSKLISAGADIDLVDHDGRTALHLVVASKTRGAVDCIIELFKAGAALNIQDVHGRTALDAFVKDFSASFTTRLIDAVIDHRIQGVYANILLYPTAVEGDVEGICKLLGAGVSVKLQDPHGRTGVALCSYRRSCRMCRVTPDNWWRSQHTR